MTGLFQKETIGHHGIFMFGRLENSSFEPTGSRNDDMHQDAGMYREVDIGIPF